MTGQAPPAPLRIAARPEAERLVTEVLATLAELETILEAETAQVRLGRIREGLAQEARKTELAGLYLRGLETVKANAIALARLAPDRLEALKGAHGRFSGVLQVNQMVLATARAVSETLVRSITEEMGRAAAPQVYAAPGRGPARPVRTEPLLVSKSL